MGKETDHVPVVKSKDKVDTSLRCIRVCDYLHHNSKTSHRVVSLIRRVEKSENDCGSEDSICISRLLCEEVHSLEALSDHPQGAGRTDGAGAQDD